MKKLMTGNEAVARGAYEAGVSFAAAYPGTPSTEILENIALYPEIVSEWAPNEKTALESTAGASIAGVRSLAAMKHVGLNVAADPLFTFAYLGVNAGSVIVTADEPGMHSSQNEQDNRNYARSARLLMFEPADSQEAKDMLKDAYEASEEFDMPVLFRMTTRVCHSKSIVDCAERIDPVMKPYEKNVLKNCPLPAHAKVMQVKLQDNLNRAKAYSETSRWNTVEDNGAQIGIIASGIARKYAKEVLGENANYLNIGFSYPLPENMIRDFVAANEKVYVIEENDPIMETEIKAMGLDVIGKEVIPQMGELLPDVLRHALLGEVNEKTAPDDDKLVPRPPALCAGCPHRGLFIELGRRKNAMIFSDIGCYSLGLAAPYNATDAMICMGAGISGAHGVSKAFTIKGEDKDVFAVMGDSTFFHSGMTSLLDVAYNHSNITAIILDNRITGMTGHQQNPGSGYTLSGEETLTADIETIVRALGVDQVKTVDPNDLSAVREALAWGTSIDGPAVIITRYPCALKRFSKEDREEFPEAFHATYKVDPDKCISCKICLKGGCPAVEFNLRGDHKTYIDMDMCLGCGVCAQLCPKGAIEKVEE